MRIVTGNGRTYVDSHDSNTKDCNPDCDIEVWSPVLYHKSRSREVGWGGDDVLKEVIPSSCESGLEVSMYEITPIGKFIYPKAGSTIRVA
jgi:hypothetical protein